MYFGAVVVIIIGRHFSLLPIRAGPCRGQLIEARVAPGSWRNGRSNPRREGQGLFFVKLKEAELLLRAILCNYRR